MKKIVMMATVAFMMISCSEEEAATLNAAGSLVGNWTHDSMIINTTGEINSADCNGNFNKFSFSDDPEQVVNFTFYENISGECTPDTGMDAWYIHNDSLYMPTVFDPLKVEFQDTNTVKLSGKNYGMIWKRQSEN